MKFFNLNKYLLLFLTCLLLHACVEPYDFETEEFDDLLLVQATLTDEMKNQEISLSRTYQLEGAGQNPLSGAQVVVHSEDMQLQYQFEEISSGIYRSDNAFAIEPGISYVLSIETDGKSYTSDPVEMITGNKIDKVVAERTALEGEDGILIQASSTNPETASRFYRYEYEETYKIVSPFRVSHNLIVDPRDWTNWWIEPNTRDEEICYNTRKSQEIILSNTSGLSENTSRSLLVRFIESEDPILAQRYSILVKQFSLTPEAYTYYSTRKKLSLSESVFSEAQPGFVYGNMHRVDEESERVIGFFSLSSVSSKRIYFNYEDFYTFKDEPRPQFPRNCLIYRQGKNFLKPVELVATGGFRYVSMSGAPDPNEIGTGPMRLIATGCVDCTVYGNNKAPEFWEE